MADKNYKLSFNMTDGTTQEVQFSVPSGETPKKGVDYFTKEDKEEFLNDVEAVRYVEQTLTEEQQAQARENIGILEPLIGTTDDITPAQVLQAIQSGRNIMISCESGNYGTLTFTSFHLAGSGAIVASSCAIDVQGAIINAYLSGHTIDNTWTCTTPTLAKQDDIPEAINTALADAKESGMFDGKPGTDGKDGVSPTVSVSKSGKVTTVSITDKNGTKTATINDGADGQPGENGNDGTSVTVKSVSESTADGGSNVVTFSDGKTLTVKNGSKGTNGTSVTVSNVSESTASGGTNVITFSDGKKVNIKNGKDGKDAYAYAQDGGYTGTEAEFSELMAQDILHKTTETISPYTNMVDWYGCIARTKLQRDGSTIDATWNVWTTNFIPIRKGQKLHIKYNDATSIADDMLWAVYDENKTLHSDYHIAIYVMAIRDNPSIYGTLTINGNSAVWDTSTIAYGGWSGMTYVRIMMQSRDCIITIDEEITDEVESVYELKPTIRVPKSNLGFDVAEKPLVGKKIVCFGDSLFGRTRDETSALYQVGQITGADVINVGFGGTSAAKVGSGAFAQFSLPALTDSIISGTWTSQDSNVSAATGWDEQLPKLKDINFATVDAIVLHYGTNDYMSAYALDGNDATSVCGGLRYSIEKLVTRYPQIKVYISLPVFRYWGSEGAYVYPETYLNSNGAKLTDYIDGIRKVAAEYNFPVIDGFHGMGVNKLNAAHYLADQTHHSMAGMKLFGEFIAAQLISQQTVAKTGGNTGGNTDGYSKAEIDAIMGSYIDAVDVLLGGD